MVGNGGKWWENGGKMVGILPKHMKHIFWGEVYGTRESQ